MDFVAVVDQVITLPRQRGRVTYRTLQRQFQLDEDTLADLLAELRYAYRDEILEEEQGVRWVDEAHSTLPASTVPAAPTARAPRTYTPAYLAEQILTSRRALEGERKQVTVLFADLKGSMELLAERDPEEARQLLDPVLEHMMAAVHRYEGTVNQVMGDGIMALFGAPLAHEDHAVRACYAALAMQEAMQRYAEEVRRTQGLLVQMRVGLHSGEVVVRAISNDLHMDYSAVGQTTHLAARMEQLAAPGSILLTAATLRLVEGLVRVQALGPVPVKGLAEPVEVYELVGVTALRRRLQAAVDGRVTAGLALAEQGVEQEVARGRPGALALLAAWLSEVYMLAGRLEEECQRATQAYDLACQNKQRGRQAWALWLLGESTARQASAEIESASGHYSQALALAEELGMRPLQAHCHRGLGMLYARQGQQEQARTALSTAIALYRSMDMRFWLPQAEATIREVAGA
jgi:class 3 adenylate cyclase